MENSTLLIKIKQRLDKLDSQDYDNIECWQFIEAFNKAQIEWCRRNLPNKNVQIYQSRNFFKMGHRLQSHPPQ